MKGLLFSLITINLMLYIATFGLSIILGGGGIFYLFIVLYPGFIVALLGPFLPKAALIGVSVAFPTLMELFIAQTIKTISKSIRDVSNGKSIALSILIYTLINIVLVICDPLHIMGRLAI